MVQVQSLVTIYLGLSLAPPNSHSLSTSVLDVIPKDKQVKFPWKLWTLVPINLIVSKASYSSPHCASTCLLDFPTNIFSSALIYGVLFCSYKKSS